MNKNIIIVGAGYSGVLIAKKLAKRFKKNEEVVITIIDKNPYHTMLTELHEVAANRVDEESIKLSLQKIFAKRKVQIKHDLITNIDFSNKMVLGEKESYTYDYLVLAAGSKPTFYGVPGAEEYTYKLWSYEDAVNLKDHIKQVFRKAASETNEEEKKKLLTFFIAGAGFTGVEMTGELAEYVPILCAQHDIERELVSIYNVDILSRTIPALTEELSRKVEKRLAKMGVTVMLNTGVEKVGSDYIEIKAHDTVSTYKTATVIWTAGIESSKITQECTKTLGAQVRGRIQVDPYLRSAEDKNVYIAGDNLFYIPKGEDKPVPQVVENCENCAEVIAKNIICEVTNKGEMQEYKPKFHGIMVSIGGRYGVARVGTPNKMFNLPSFFAMFTKHFINMVYFIQVLGWNKIFSYLKHEFFTIRNCRSFVGGHFSNRTPSFLLVPLRVWLGAVWLFEGIKKVLEGWFNTPMLTDFFGGANSWYNSIIKGADAVSVATGEASKVVDAVTSSTGAGSATEEIAKQVGTVIFNIDFLGIFRAIFVTGKTLLESTIGDYAFKLDVPIMNWFINSFVLPYDGVQITMQIFIVLAEILIGLALIGGLFATPAAALSLVLQFMFVATTGLYLGTFWMIFAGIAVLVGAGRTLGLDYYFMPFLKKKWKNISWVRKSYLYHD